MSEESLADRLALWRTRTILSLKDRMDAMTGRRDEMIPPRLMMFDGPQDPKAFRESGEEFLRYYVDLCYLRPDETMLDIGCGIGRKTIPLTRYLSDQGTYMGFDINPVGIEWCKSKISSRHPNFYFHRADIFNQRYNPTGRQAASAFRFPFPDGLFDFAAAASVFTHMLPNEVDQYMSETARVLKQGGRTLFSFFVLDEEAKERMGQRNSAYSFAVDYGAYAVEREDRPEDAVAYDLAFIEERYARYGLNIRAIYPGSWSGRPNYLSFQDLVVAVKE